jgi:hypothetical protein
MGKRKGGGEPPKPEPEPTFEFSDDITYSFQIGPLSDEYIVEYYGDIPTDDMLGPNACKGKGRNPIAPILCGISLFMSFPSIGSQQGSYEANFWIHLSVNYSELHHSIYVSNLSMSSSYDGVAMLKSLDVQSGDLAHTIYSTSYNYPMHPGFGSSTIVDSGGVFNATDRITYEANLQFRVDAGNGPFDMPQTINLTLPSLYELKNFITNVFP